MGFRPSPKPHIPRSRSLRRREIRERIGRTDSSASHQSGSGARTRNALPGTTSLLYSIQQQKGPAGAGGFAKKRRKIFARTRSVDGRKKKKETTKGKSVFEKSVLRAPTCNFNGVQLEYARYGTDTNSLDCARTRLWQLHWCAWFFVFKKMETEELQWKAPNIRTSCK